jgi:hypothetical protein
MKKQAQHGSLPARFRRESTFDKPEYHAGNEASGPWHSQANGALLKLPSLSDSRVCGKITMGRFFNKVQSDGENTSTGHSTGNNQLLRAELQV